MSAGKAQGAVLTGGGFVWTDGDNPHAEIVVSAPESDLPPDQAEAREDFLNWARLNPDAIARCLASPLGRRFRNVKEERAAGLID